jgi:hypothetical protein
MIFALFIEDPATHWVTVQTYPSAFLRGLMMITLRAQPVVLSTRDYPEAV